MLESTALGAAMAAGAAKDVAVWDLESLQPFAMDTFTPSIEARGEICTMYS